jgi:hypothetical protein
MVYLCCPSWTNTYYTNTKAKCRHLKKSPIKGLCGRCLSVRPTYGGEGPELNQREDERGSKSQSWVENTNMTECTQEIGYLQSINTDKHLPQSPFLSQFFRWQHFALPSMSLIFLWGLYTQYLLCTVPPPPQTAEKHENCKRSPKLAAGSSVYRNPFQHWSGN